MTRIPRGVAALFLAAVVVAGGRSAIAQLKFLRGQNLAPVFEGWRKEADGKTWMYFGYLNRNYEEALDIPVGPSNGFDAGDVDRGQPTHFLTRRQRFVFKVPLPSDWDAKRRLIWTVTANGKTERAQGWLQPEWEIDDGVIQMNIGPGGAPPTDPPNLAPKITGTADQSISAGETLMLTVHAIDDGIPKPRKPAPGATAPAAGSAGVEVRWIHYRGAGAVKFAPEKSARVYGKPVDLTTRVTFSSPGIYVLRAIASDGLLETSNDVTVTVK